MNKKNAYNLIRTQIRRMERCAQHYTQQLTQEHGITGPQLGVLRLIGQTPSTTLTTLSTTLQLHITTVESFIERLHKRKLIKKQRKRDDKRSIAISITAAGNKVLREAPVGGFVQLDAKLRKLPEPELQHIYNALKKLAELYGASDITL